MQLADELWPERKNLLKIKTASKHYREIIAAEHSNYEAYWKLARNLCWIAEHTKDEERLNAAREAVEAAKNAVALKPDDPAGHFYLGLAYGYFGHSRGVLSSLFLIKPVEDSFKRVIELEPGFEGGAAYTALGRGYFFWPGHLDEAIAYFNKALKYGPKVFGTHLFLAEAYMKAGEKERARKLLEGILKGPAQPGQEPEYEEWRGEAEYLMRKLDEMD